MFDPAVWGTVGQWASATGTTLAFTATFYVIRRDARVRRYAQARKVAFFVQPNDVMLEAVDDGAMPPGALVVKNLSDEPIYDVFIFTLRDSRRHLTMTATEVLLPGVGLAHLPDEDAPLFGHKYGARFRDNSIKWWDRTLTGNLREIGRLEHWLEATFEVEWPIPFRRHYPARSRPYSKY